MALVTTTDILSLPAHASVSLYTGTANQGRHGGELETPQGALDQDVSALVSSAEEKLWLCAPLGQNITAIVCRPRDFRAKGWSVPMGPHKAFWSACGDMGPLFLPVDLKKVSVCLAGRDRGFALFACFPLFFISHLYFLCLKWETSA